MITYPHTAGSKVANPETSVAAAPSVGAAEALRQKCYAELKRESLTADEVAERISESILSVRPRISELRALGKIEPTRDRRKNASGHSACVWRIADPHTKRCRSCDAPIADNDTSCDACGSD